MSVFLNHPGFWGFLVLFAAAVAGAVLIYRAAPSSVGRRLRALLVGLRVAVLVVIFFMLLEPVVRLARTVTERPVVVVLLDASRSMAIPDGTGGARRGDEAVGLLNEMVVPRVARDAEVDAYVFSSSIEPLTTERGVIAAAPVLEGGATDLGGALSAIKSLFSERNLSAVVVATDGAVNRGCDPRAAGLALGVPVYTLGVGSADDAVDVSVREPLTNRISYAGEALPIETRISWSGLAGGHATVELREGEALVETASVDLENSSGEALVSFRAVPSTPGVHRYTILVPPVPGEVSVANNTRVVSTHTLEGRIGILLVGARPSHDYAFANRALASDPNVDLQSVAVRGGSSEPGAPGLPLSEKDLLERDVVMMIGADWADPPISADWLVRFVRERGGGLLLMGLPPSEGPVGGLEDVAPVILAPVSAPALRETRVRLTPEGEAAATTRVTRDRFENASIWASLPPIWTATTPWWTARPDAAVLVTGGSAEPERVPLYIGSRHGTGNVLALLADGIWRWKMAGPDDVDVHGRILAAAARWLTSGADLERVVVTTDKDVYAAGEEIRFSAQVYRSDYRVARDASVSVSVSRGTGAVPLEAVDLVREGDFHRGTLGPLAPGSYTFLGVGRTGPEEVGEASGEFVVEEFSLEDAEVRRRPAVLRRLASETGGLYVSPETLDELPDSASLERRSVSVVRELELWNSPWPFVGLVGLLSLEWALRRRKGLP